MSTKRRGKQPKSGGVVTALTILFPAGLIFLPTAILLVVGMIPTVVAYMVDKDPDKTAPMTVGALNFVGVMAYAIALWKAGHSLAALNRLVTDPFAWLVMYGAAALGWGLYYGVPPAVAGWIALRAENRIAKRVAEQQELVAEWGREVTGVEEDEGGKKS